MAMWEFIHPITLDSRPKKTIQGFTYQIPHEQETTYPICQNLAWTCMIENPVPDPDAKSNMIRIFFCISLPLLRISLFAVKIKISELASNRIQKITIDSENVTISSNN